MIAIERYKQEKHINTPYSETMEIFHLNFHCYLINLNRFFPFYQNHLITMMPHAMVFTIILNQIQLSLSPSIHKIIPSINEQLKQHLIQKGIRVYCELLIIMNNNRVTSGCAAVNGGSHLS